MKLWSLSGSSSHVFGVYIYGRKVPVVIKWIYNGLLWLQDAKWWWLWRFHPDHQYHLVRTGLLAGYHDTDERMLHANMTLLCEYIEKQHDGVEALEAFTHDLQTKPENWGPMNGDPDPELMATVAGQASRQDEATKLYRWWKFERPANRALLEKQLMSLYGERVGAGPQEQICTMEEYRAFNDKVDQDDQDALHRLIDIRRSLWT